VADLRTRSPPRGGSTWRCYAAFQRSPIDFLDILVTGAPTWNRSEYMTPDQAQRREAHVRFLAACSVYCCEAESSERSSVKKLARAFCCCTYCCTGPKVQLKSRCKPALTRGGAKGTRTPNPLLAKQVRYQLRHGPGWPRPHPPRAARPTHDGTSGRLARTNPLKTSLQMSGL
jgi:hypothetical protein